MPNSVYFPPPPAPEGSERERIDQIWRYLYRLSEQLNMEARTRTERTEKEEQWRTK